jgi:4-amino-4-deoxy-L-arabinose transferase-like glycosyltransferase
VTETTAPIDESPRTSTAARTCWTILIAATLYVCYFSHLGAIGFVGPDEPRYAWIARDMAETGDWVTPRLYGKPWFEKPPLFYWGAGLCFKLFGVSEAAARLPSAISALLATLALAWLALRLYGAETARWLLLLLPTTVGMIGFSHAAATDMPFSGMLTIAMVCAAVVLGLTQNENTPILPRTPWLALVLFGFFLGLAVLAKGPAALILVGGAIFFWALSTKRWRDAFSLFHPAALASFCLTALPWYILCARRNPDFFRIFIIEHNFKRYLTPEFQHIQPLWFYVPIMLLAVLPWTSLLTGLAHDLRRQLQV